MTGHEAQPRDIVVGVDGSSRSEQAVRWAAREAAIRGCAVRVIFAYEWVTPGMDFTVGPPPEGSATAAYAEAAVAGALDVAREAAPGVQVTGSVAYGAVVPALLSAAEHAALVVVGSRGHGGFVNLVLGSVSQQIATHAPCPVVVVRDGAQAHDGPVVVGADLSAGTTEALHAAFAAAQAYGTNLVVIHAHRPPIPSRGAGAVPPAPDAPGYDTGIRAALAVAVQSCQERYPDVKVEILIAHGHPAHVLADVSATARLVVVGTRGHGGFAGLLLGSVAEQVLHHAAAPVLVARPVTRR